MKKLCIYHGNCADGFTSAWIVKKVLGDNVDFFPGFYQTPPPNVLGRDVILVDFSYKLPTLLEMAAIAKSITILDHHKTAEEDLMLFMGGTKVFDMNRSGARITWDHYFPGQQPPKLVLHVEDRDLWRFKLPRTREIQANIFSFPYDFGVWDTIANDLENNWDAFAHEGMAIERKHFKDIEELLLVTTRLMKIGGLVVPVANLPYIYSSDAGHELSKNFPFAACYWDTPDGRVFSLRSGENGVDVSAVAKEFGGGGHRNAAGFKVSFAKAQEFEIAK